MSQSKLIVELINTFKVLPGVGAKSAQRMAYYLLEKDKSGGLHLVNTLKEALNKVKPCQKCQDLTENELCNLCQSSTRNHQELCVVEAPSDVIAIEQSGIYKGLYFVLMGHLSPIDGIGPDELGLPKLKERLQHAEPSISELIIATNPTVEGEATAFYLQQMAEKLNIKVTRLAQGIPLGGELEYIDSGTLGQAFVDRK
jgi:recombination protein RecR